MAPAFWLCLVMALAGASPDRDADAEILARIAAGDVAQAAALAQALIDREAAEPGRSPSLVADHLQRLAEQFYGAGTKASLEAAGRFFDRALELRRARADQEPGPLADLLHDLSSVHFNNGDYDKAEHAERQCLEIRGRIYPRGDTRTAQSRRDLGLIFLYQGRLQEAATYLVEALKESGSSQDQDWTEAASGRNYLAELYRLQGRSADAARVLEDLVREAPGRLGADDPQVAYYLNNLAGVYRDQERFDEAETLLRRSLALRKAAVPRDDSAVALATLNIAELYRAQGKLAAAEPLYAEALELARATLQADSPRLLEFLNQSAVLYREQGRLELAAPRFREALDLVEKTLGPGHPRAAQSRLDLAELLREKGRCEEADADYRRASEIRRQALGPDHPLLAEALTAHARCLGLDPRRRAAALSSLDQALGILGASLAHPAVLVDALAQRADLARESDPEGARRDLAEALRVVESMRPHRGGGEGVRAEFFGRYAPLYYRMVDWEIAAGRPDRALAAAERGRARALLDQLAAAHVGESGSLPPELEDRRTAARAELAEIHQRIAFEQARTNVEPRERLARVTALERRLDEAMRSYRQLYDETRNASAAWRGAAAGEPVTAGEIQREVVPGRGMLLLYEIGDRGSFVFAVPPAPGVIEARALVAGPEDAAALGVDPGPLTGASLGRILSGDGVAGVLAQLSSPQSPLARGIGGLSSGTGLDVNRLHALWRILIPAEFWGRLVSAREVLVIPDGPLFLLPLEALVVKPGADLRSSRFWIDAGPVLRYAPSATFVRDLGRGAATPAASIAASAARPAALSVSDPIYASAGGSPGAVVRGAWPGGVLPRLPGTARETRAVQAALGAVAEVAVLQGAAAREPAVRAQIAGKRYLHIATHGLVGSAGRPDLEQGAELFAALALTPPPSGAPTGDDDGFLQLFEIYDLRLDAELAVLSACGSNTGRVVAGEGIFALSRGFLVAGARRVVASQWPVDDSSTAELVGDLFRRVAEASGPSQGFEAARALRDAKLHLRKARAGWAHPFFWAPFVITGLP